MTSSENGAEPLLRLEGVSKNFGPVQALSDVDLDIPAGEVTALIGDNGAGKSVTIKMHRRDPSRPSTGRSSGRGSRSGFARLARPPRSGSRPSTRISRSVTTWTSCKTCSSGGSA